MTPADLSRTVLHAVRRAVDENALRAPVPARVRVERTRPGGSGDYACAVALQLAGPAGLPALEVARILRERVAAEPGIGRVEITGRGFLSLSLDAPADNDRAVLDAVREQGIAYGHGDALRGEVLRLHHAREVRAAVTADAVRRLLTAQGAQVRIDCEEAGDPEWSRLGVPAEAYGAPPVPPGPPASADVYGTPPAPPGPPAPLTVIRPVPAGVTAGELLERFGADAARWGLLRPAAHDRAPLGGELLVQGEANPLFRVRYAHARARALTRGAAALGFTALGSAAEAVTRDEAESAAHAGPGPASYEDVGPGPYSYRESAARPLLDLLADHPGVLLAAARHRAPDRVARQLEAVAHAFFDFHDSCPPLPSGDEKPSAAHRSRLALAEAAGTVLAGGLSLLGIGSPAHL
ncbi:ArgS-related anticodon-binding protein NrtL [Streptomyces sp. NPDC007346]|uniref:ArgS-related anticodon-binding protein NrtL n=1 Tax=Streptomyces sp. NPDC007346 TaxID=3154682 RepID=UPI003452BE23